MSAGSNRWKMEQHTLKVSFIFADGRGQLQDDDSDGKEEEKPS
jgi:hypothetical protein